MSIPSYMKLNVVGSEKVGKTSLLSRYKFDEFPTGEIHKIFENREDLWQPGVNANYTIHFTTSSEQNVEVELIETLVNPYNDRIRPLHYIGVNVFLLCFAVNSRQSFNSITRTWIPEIRHWATKKVPILLVATKCDLLNNEDEQELVSVEEGEELARNIDALEFFQCSAKTGENVEKVFKAAYYPGLENIIYQAKKKKRTCSFL